MNLCVRILHLLASQSYLYSQHLTLVAQNEGKTRKHSSRMRADRAVTRRGSEIVAMRPIVDRQTPVKTLPSPCGR